jgi:pectinesterase inhibitor-like protein
MHHNLICQYLLESKLKLRDIFNLSAATIFNYVWPTLILYALKILQPKLRAAALYAKETADQVFVEQRNTFSAPEYETCLNDCQESIEDSIQQLDDTTKAVDLRAFEDVEDWVAAAVADASTCKESCKGPNGEPRIKQLGDMTTEFTELCKVILALSKLDEQGQH